MKIFYDKHTIDEIPCDSTITGSCEKKSTLNDCVKSCTPNKNCFWGVYYNDSKKCIPVNYDNFINLNPHFLLRDKEGVNVFMDEKKFEIPPDRKNKIYMYDTVRLIQVESNISIIPDIMFISPTPFLKRPKNYIPMALGEPILLFNKNSDRIIKPGTDRITWVKSLKYIYQKYEEFYLEPIDIDITYQQPLPSKKILDYNGLYYIKTSYNAYLSLYPNRYENHIKQAPLEKMVLGNKNISGIFKLEKVEELI